MRRLLLVALLPLLSHAAPPPPVNLPPPPPLPAEGSAIINDEVEVRIVEEKEATITEYRSRGKLYMIKVIPKIGAPYYLIDKEGNGRFDRGENPANSNMVVPMWTLFEF